MGLIQVERLIAADPAKVFALAKEAERFPDVVPDLTEVKAVEKDGARVVTTWRGTLSIAGMINRGIYWKEEDIWDDAARKCTFSLIEGDMKKYSGDWTFEDAPDGSGGTLVKLSVDFELGVPMIGPLVVRLVDKLVKENCEALLAGLAKLAEGG
ncbi:MAG: SRPBCC family protein [bacterium]|jgi:ribosome-associated toxin RatA of RatAB toxin-antitoxin module